MKRLVESILSGTQKIIKHTSFEGMFNWIGQHVDTPFDWDINDEVWNKLFSITNNGELQFGDYGFDINMGTETDVVKSFNVIGSRASYLSFFTKAESINIDVQQIKDIDTLYISGINLKHIYLNGNISCNKLEISSRAFETIEMGDKVNILIMRTTTTSMNVGRCKFNKFLKMIHIPYEHDEETFKQVGAINAKISHHL